MIEIDKKIKVIESQVHSLTGSGVIHQIVKGGRKCPPPPCEIGLRRRGPLFVVFTSPSFFVYRVGMLSKLNSLLLRMEKIKIKKKVGRKTQYLTPTMFLKMT